MPDAATHQRTYTYPDDIDPVLGYAPGRVITNDLLDYRSEQAAEAVLRRRFDVHGEAGIHNMMMLVDNCEVPDFFEGYAYRERYLGLLLCLERLDPLAKEHMGGGPDHRTMAFNRTSAANLTVILALATPGSRVPYLVVPYPRPTIAGHGHPSIPRAVELARAELETMTTTAELESSLETGEVSLVTVCPSYRGVIAREVFERACALGNQHGVPVFVDDASGARLRTLGEGQPRAIDAGADLVVTSTEKYGLDGPRACVLVGRSDLVERVGAQAAMLGTEARPSVAAAIVRALEAFTPERARAIYGEWEEAHRELYVAMVERLGERVRWKGYAGVSLMLEDIMEIAMDRAGIDRTALAPVDIATAVAMILLRRYGYMTIPALHYPGASKALMIHLAQPSSRSITPTDVAAAIDDAFSEAAELFDDRTRLEALLFGPPDLEDTACP